MTEISIPDFNLQDDRLFNYRIKVIRVVDGDTVIGLLDAGFSHYEVVNLRLAGIDAPETRPRKSTGSEEQVAAEKVLAKLSTDRLKELVEGKEVVIKSVKSGKFGRKLAIIYLPEDPSKTAQQVLMEEGLAVEYGKPRPWRNE